MEVASHPKILYVITKANWGGAQRYVFDLATAAKERHYNVLVACGGEGELTERLRERNIKVELVAGLGRDVRFGSDLRALISLYQLMRRELPNIVHLNSSKAGFTGAVAARFARVPKILFTAHGWAFNENRPWLQRYVFAVLHYLTLLMVDTAICNSKATYDDVAGMWGVKNRLVVIHNGVHITELRTRASARALLAPDFLEKFWIGTLAELHPVKGLDIAIKAFAEVAKRFPDAVLVLMGEGQERSRLEALVRTHGLESRVRFCGHVAEGAACLPAFDLFLLPSRSESFGYVVVEAGLAQVPVVASRVGGVPEIITDRVNGVLVPPDDISALANAIAGLIEHPEKRSEFAENLYKRAMQDFSIQKMLEKTFSLYSA